MSIGLIVSRKNYWKIINNVSKLPKNKLSEIIIFMLDDVTLEKNKVYAKKFDNEQLLDITVSIPNIIVNLAIFDNRSSNKLIRSLAMLPDTKVYNISNNFKLKDSFDMIEKLSKENIGIPKVINSTNKEFLSLPPKGVAPINGQFHIVKSENYKNIYLDISKENIKNIWTLKYLLTPDGAILINNSPRTLTNIVTKIVEGFSKFHPSNIMLEVDICEPFDSLHELKIVQIRGVNESDLTIRQLSLLIDVVLNRESSDSL